jgi:hypothetical protein
MTFWATLAMMSESLEETLKEASLLRELAVEEEVLIGAASISKTCNNALRYARHIRTQLTRSKS